MKKKVRFEDDVYEPEIKRTCTTCNGPFTSIQCELCKKYTCGVCLNGKVKCYRCINLEN